MPLDETVWVIEDPRKKTISKETIQIPSTRFPKPLRNPVVSFSLSLLVWGLGQIYNGQRKLGFLLMLLMANFYLYLALMIYYWESITTSLKPMNISNSYIFIAYGIFYLMGLLLWISSAYQAYYKTMKMRTITFQGVNTPFWPFLCSFLIPGWGQFLNGQTRKGSCFMTFSLIGFFVFPASFFVLLVWLTLETFADRFFFEKILAFALILSPIIFLMWIINIHDALKVCQDSIKKEPLRKRIEYAINKIRLQGWRCMVLPRMKMILMLSLFLIFFLILGYYCFPTKYYVTQLQDLQAHLYQQKMVIIPEFISKFLELFT